VQTYVNPGAGRLWGTQRAYWLTPLRIAFAAWAVVNACPCCGTSLPWRGPRVVDLRICDDTVLVAWSGHERESWIACYRAATGNLLWRRRLPGATIAGRAAAGGDILAAASPGEGVYVLDRRSGAVAKLLREPADGTYENVALSPNRIVAVSNGARWDAAVTAFDRPGLRMAWRRTFAARYAWAIVPTAGIVRVLLSAPFGPGRRPDRYESVVVSLGDGRVVSRKPVPEPLDRHAVPLDLTAPLQRWLGRALRRRGGVVAARTRIERYDGFCLVGVLGDRDTAGRVYAIASRSGRVVWQREVPNLGEIARRGTTLVVAACGQPRTTAQGQAIAGRLTALDCRTGRLAWAARL
jgi:outer membrane protein assembly factor BamB